MIRISSTKDQDVLKALVVSTCPSLYFAWLLSIFLNNFVQINFNTSFIFVLFLNLTTVRLFFVIILVQPLQCKFARTMFNLVRSGN
jgi:hypothetical protein